MSGQTFIIAEAGVNHNGSLDRALAMVDAAVRAGADAIKFQTFRAESLVTPDARKAAYQAAASGSDVNQFGMLKALELDVAAHRALVDKCARMNFEFMSTAFDVDSLRFLTEEIGIRRVKIPSGEITNPLLLLAAARTGLPLLLSTGMATLGEIEDALSVVAFGLGAREAAPSINAFRQAFEDRETRNNLARRVTLLQCTTAYPAPPQDLNLRVMSALGAKFNVPVGFSDHSTGTAASVVAIGCGATVIEKHFTLDRGLPGPDHAASIEPDELTRMIHDIRIAESALGSAHKEPADSERANMSVARRGLYAARDIRQGDILREADIAILRPENGLPPMRLWDLIGRAAMRDYRRFESLS